MTARPIMFTVTAPTTPAWRSTMVVGEAKQITSNTVASVANRDIMEYYNGAGFDDTNEDLYFHGGGHQIGYNNAVVRVRPSADAPSFAVVAANSGIQLQFTDGSTEFYPDGRAAPSHTRCLAHWINETGQFARFGSHDLPSGATQSVNRLVTWTQATDTWAAVPTVNVAYGANSVRDPLTRRIYLLRWNEVLRYWHHSAPTVATNWGPVPGGGSELYYAAAIDTLRRTLLWVGNAAGSPQTIRTYPLDTQNGAWSSRTITGDNPYAFAHQSNTPGLIYAPELDAYLVLRTNGLMYRINASTFAGTLITPTSGTVPAATGPAQGVYSRFYWSSRYGGVYIAPHGVTGLWFWRMV
jgi:hypothetical protein